MRKTIIYVTPLKLSVLRLSQFPGKPAGGPRWWEPSGHIYDKALRLALLVPRSKAFTDCP